MNFALTSEQEELKTTMRRFLSDRLPTARVRTIMESHQPLALDAWKEMASDLGVGGLLIPESHGGLGMSFIEAACVLQEIGRGVAPLPFFATSIIGASLLTHSSDPDDPVIHNTLVGIADGEVIIGLMAASGDQLMTPCGTSSAGKIYAESRFVLDGSQATNFLVALEGTSGVDVALVEASAPGITVTPKVTLDLTRPLAHVRIDGAPGHIIATLTPAALETLETLASASLAQDMVGGAERVLEMSVQYAKDRHQFGRPIGSFQAIKHRLADMLVDVESAKSAALYAAFTLTEESEDRSIAGAMAKSICGDAYFRVAAASIQVHGGIGFTWEHDAHLFFKRAKADQILFGNSASQRRKLAHLLGIA